MPTNSDLADSMELIQKRLSAVEQTVGRDGDRISAVERKVEEVNGKVNSVQETTTSIKSDTEEIIALYKGSRIVGSILRWMFVTLAAVGGSVATIKVFMGG